MGSFRIASRYAKSLLELSKEKNQLDASFADIKSLDNAFENSRELRILFKSPIIPTDKKLSIAEKLFKGKISDFVYQFVVLLIKKGREAFLHEIANSFIEQFNSYKGITPVKLQSAVKLDSQLVKNMIDNLKKKENLKEVIVTEELDESLIGGFVLTYGDKMVDTSISRKLQQLHNIIQDDTYVKKYS